MKLTKVKQKQLDEAYDTLIQVCLYDRPLKDMEPFLADDVMNFGAGRKELTKTKAAFLKQIKNQKKLAAGLKMDFQIKPVLRKITNKGDGAIYTDDIVNTVLVNGVKNKLKFRLSFIFEYREDKWIMLHSHTSTPDSQRSDDEVWPVEELKKRTEVLEKSLDEKIAELEIKNRELEIEAALERVRAKTMAMHQSDELREAVRVIYEQLQHLGFDSNACNIIIIDKESGNMQYWVSGFTQEIFPEGYYVPYLSHPFHEELLEASRQNKKYDVMEYSGTLKKSFDDIFFTQTDFRKIPEEAKAFMKALESVKLSTAFFTYGALQVLGPAELTGERSKILEQFAKVFDLTYTRFLDLQKAEAQAREATIEMLLERVRARSMAMHHSSDLQEVIKIVADQFVALKLKFDSASFGKVLPDGSWDLWIATPDQPYPAQVYFPYFDHKAFKHVNELFAKKIDFSTDQFTYAEKNSFFQYFFEHTAAKNIPEERKQYVLKGEGFARSIFILKNIMFTVAKYAVVPFTDEENAVFKRFANVFEQAYTRFLDLQKAEAQAREAQIEASLERVRASAMAMHHSDELSDVLTVLFAQFDVLNIRPVDVHLDLFDLEKNTFSYRATGKEGKRVIAEQIVEIDSRPEWQSLLERWKKGKPNTVGFSYYPKEAIAVLMTFFPAIWEAMPEDSIMSPEDFPDGIYDTLGYCKFGYIGFHHYRNATEEEKNILIRFANEFERLYQRFLDLQKAEAQARESQIQLALERVRARTMAMQRSDELAEAASLLFKQVNDLGINPWGAGFNIWQPDGLSCTAWMANPDGGINPPFRTPHTEDSFFIKILAANHRGEEFFVMETGGEELEETYRYMYNLQTAKEVLGNLETLGFHLPKFQVNHCAFFSQGYLLFITHTQCPEAWDIFKRFAKVFEQTYTRFLDLQKAEAQAREAQIEAALERVRSRTMAMHRSEEIADILGKMFEELKRLDMVLVRVLIWIFNHDEKYISWWSANAEVETTANSYRVDYNEHPVFLAVLEAWQKKVPLKLYTLSGAEKEFWQDHLFNNTGLSKLPDMVQKGMRSEGTIFTTSAISDYGLLMSGSLEPLSDENTDIIQRFGRVFQQSYTRYIDVQKAEEQAREAQIQLALERVRARAMAMQTSEELHALIGTVFTELTKLDLTLVGCDIIIFDTQTNSSQWWMVNSEAPTEPLSFFIKYHQHPPYLAFIDAWKQRKLRWVYELKGNTKKEWDDFLFNETELSLIPPQVIANMKGHESVFLSSSFNNFGCLNIGTRERLSEEHFDILLRFAKVFDLTYTRFNDLKQAEAQAKEAKIQLALERVRAKTMAMHKSDELMEAANLLFQQVQSLGIPVWGCGYNIWEKGEKVGIAWMSVQGAIQPSFRIPLTEHSTFIHMYESRLKAEPFYVEEVSGEELADHYRYMFSLPDFAEIARQQLGDRDFPLPQSQIHHVFNFKHGNLIFLSAEAIPGAWDIFKRFTAVFEQTYTRFLDLQKAEAQAREAQIEAALEKVRSRSLAMHTANELGEVVTVIVEKLKDLGVVLDANGVVLCTYFQNSKDVLHWIVSPDYSMAGSYLLPYFDHPIFNAAWQSKENGEEYFSRAFSVAEKNSFFEHAFEHSDYRHFPDELKQWIFQNDQHILSFAWQKNSAILIPSHTGVLPSEEDIAILKRFAKVFEQSYVRFLDLQKAEAQAREARLETALEKVRSRTMAMHKSEELAEAAQVLFHQLAELGSVPDRISIGIVDETNDVVSFWSTDQSGSQIAHSFTARLNESTTIAKLYKAWKARQKSLIVELHGKDLEDWLRFAREEMGVIVKDEFFNDRRAHSAAFFSHGWILESTHEPQSIETLQVLERFAAVFNLTYTRFLDLQKAEAQAKEAKIEAALERVRSRSMAMHKSDELAKVASVMFEEIRILGGELWSTGLVLCEKDKPVMEQWMSMTTLGLLPPFHIPVDLDKFHRNMYEAWKTGVELYTEEFTETEIKRRHELLMGIPNVREAFDKIREAGIQAPKWQKNYVAPFKNGVLFTIVTIPFGDEKIFPRFARVFEQTYTRFLDLKKSEAQAREAQIELGLERVRARAMAMQKSDELAELIDTLQKELTKLEFTLNNCIFWIMDEEPPLATWWIAPVNQTSLPESYRVPFPDLPYFKAAFKAWKKRIKKWVYELKGNDKKEADRYIFTETDLTRFPDDVKKTFSEVDKVYISFSFYNYGGLHISTKEPLTEEQLEIINRFSKVFDMTYTRFLDLQKAEAQAREAQIELGLERVRARAMAMQRSDELKELIATVSAELGKLDLVLDRCFIHTYDSKSSGSTWWMANPETPAEGIGLFVKYHEHSPYLAYLDAWRNRAMKWQYILEGTVKKTWDEFLFVETELSRLPGLVIENMRSKEKVYLTASFNNFGCLTLATLEPLSGEQSDIMLRFAKVFDLTYTRFNDLQKAEAQAKEAQIEAALERVRSRTMAMHKSDELLEVINVVSGQLQQLNFKFDNVSFGENNADYDIKFWMSIKARPHPILCHAPYVDNPIINRVKEAQKKGRGYLFSDILTREENQQWIHHLYNNADVNFPEEIKNFLLNSPGYSRTVIILNNIFFFIGNYSAIRYTDEENSIFSRFGNVFEQSYTRFLDLQKAEAQAREAQIETALERVRSRSLAMHRSDELQEVVNTVFERLKELEIDMNSANIAIFKEGTKDLNYWIASPVQNRSASFHLPYFDLTIIKDLFIAREDGKDFFSKSYSFEEKNEWFAHAFSHSDFQFLTEDRKQFIIGTDAYTLAIAMARNTGVQVNRYSSKPFSEADVEILKRFSRVFEQAYIRFLDLQKAEAQAREAQIETSLERVRSKAMAMQKPDELVEVAELLRKEMGLLGVEELETSSIYIHNEVSGKTECWFAIKDSHLEKKLIADHMTIDLKETGVGRQMMEFYRSDKKQISIVMQGAKRKEWITYCADHAKVFGSSGFYGDNIPDRTYHLYKFSNGYMGAASPGDISAESWGLLQRATTVFSLAYTRFNDLQQAETSAREAVKQAALDRVRAEIASMRTISDLDRITPLIWNELNILGIRFIRCGVFIMDESQQLIHTFLSSPDGKAIAAFHLPYDTPGHFPDVIDHWRNKKIYVSRWSEDDFLGIANTLLRQGAIATKEQYLGTLPKGGFYLHFLPFLQGLLYVGNTDQLGEEEIILIQHVADAFSTAYARYEDFNKLEAAKQQVDKTLTDLKQAQTQLVQSEKMASLGELTAGIAHEIQNPLNFVNNFSDVSNELLEEMKGELATGNMQQAIEIAEDVKQNLEKILHHGKRADAIVKGMLQHSRTSSGQKEPTDINILADEYLRLAYHGLRAKDKSFNAKFETSFDDRIGKINIIPQEMGRVILNLINNGFYAVSEKKKLVAEGYDPTVIISTSKDNGKVEIKVRDNGIGIPQKMLDKIFQPFFTTKPTGEGTGLGLSLAYDIVKAHGGELKVETSEGEGSEFIIQLPVNKAE